MTLEARTVLRQLAARFGQPTKPQLDPLDEFVLTVLSQSTTDTNRDRAWTTLLKHFPNPNKQAGIQVAWEDVRQLGREKLEDLIRVAGLAGQKAGTIHAALDRLAAEVGELTRCIRYGDCLLDRHDRHALQWAHQNDLGNPRTCSPM